MIHTPLKHEETLCTLKNDEKNEDKLCTFFLKNGHLLNDETCDSC